MRVAYEEQETIINFPRNSSKAIVWTSDTTVMTKLDRLCEKSDAYKLVDVGKALLGGEVLSKEYEVADKSLVSFRSKKIEREPKPMTLEMKLMLEERLQKARDAKNKKSDVGREN